MIEARRERRAQGGMGEKKRAGGKQGGIKPASNMRGRSCAGGKSACEFRTSVIHGKDSCQGDEGKEKHLEKLFRI